MFSLNSMVLCISCVVVGSSASALAPFIKPCTREDSECIANSAAVALPRFIAGIPEFGISPMEPLIFKDIKADRGDLKLFFKDLLVTGASKTKFVSIVRDTALTCKLVVDIPVNVTGHYVMSGTFIQYPIEGDGDCNFHTNRLRILLDIKLKTFNDKEGKKHYKVTGYDYKYDFVEKMFLHFGNLFNGDEAQVEPFKKFLDENWKVMAGEVGAPVFEAIIKECAKNIGKLFVAVPADELEIA